MLKSIQKDIQAVFDRDPAARSTLEVILCYPGLHALWFHRISHFIWSRKMYLLSRLISNFSRWLTGVEIHPGAQIGSSVFIDHGAGVVIGETSEIGVGCLIYQGAVLGGTCKGKIKRHPTLGKNVEVGAGAVILGPVRIGAGARIGAGSVVIRDVPEKATVIGVPARVAAKFSAREIDQLQHGRLPDPVAEAIKLVLEEQKKLENRIAQLETMEGLSATIDRVCENKKIEILKEFSSPEETFHEGTGI